MTSVKDLSHELRDRLRQARRSGVDRLAMPLTWASAAWLRRLRRKHRIEHLPKTRQLFMNMGVYPIFDHYYEPLIDRRVLDFDSPRTVPGIDWRLSEQWQLVEGFAWADELAALPRRPADAPEHGYFLDNGYFGAGDADVYYSLVRQLKPKRVVEIGSGHSTRLAAMALARNEAEGSAGRLICIEPYRRPEWLEAVGAELIAERVEAVGDALFRELEPGDILFIDSSHMVRPQGDVLFEVQQLLPLLPPGVVVHVHDVFSPADYPREWQFDKMQFWNEQYVLEAFLMFNPQFEVLCGLQCLFNEDSTRLEKALPCLSERRTDIAMTSFWFRRTAS